MKTIINTLLFALLLSPLANAGLTVQDNLSAVFGTLGNYTGTTIVGSVSGDAGSAIVGDGDVVRIIGAFEHSAAPTGPTTGNPALTSYAALVYASELATGSGNLTNATSPQTFTAADMSSDLSNLLTGSIPTSAAAILLTSDTYDFSSAADFSALNTAAGVTSNGIQVAAAYDLASDYAVEGFVGGGTASLTYQFALNQTYIDSTATDYFGTVDSSGNEVIVTSSLTYSMSVNGPSWNAGAGSHTLGGLNHVQVNAVPEPTSLAALASLGVIGLLYRRKK